MSELMTQVGASAESVRQALARDPENVVEQRPQYACPACQDRGQVLFEKGGNRFARQCECMRVKAAARRMRNAGVPARYAEASFSAFRTANADPSLGTAKRIIKGAVDDFLMHPGGQAVLLTGTCGTGKTHLAAAALKETMLRYGVQGKFWDMGDLLTQMKRTFSGEKSRGGEVGDTEASILDECAAIDVLVLDELGGERLTEWSYSEVSLLLNARYNGQGDKPRLTIFTTNFRNAAPGELRGEESLGDRIGARMYSRVQEMCRVVEMTGKDFRIGRNG
jgi:DNA replication protein DnaC